MFDTLVQDTRPAPSKHKEWVPHSYQRRAVAFLMNTASGALFLDPGLGKCQPVNEPVYTPSGWVPIGDLNVGDYVYSQNGNATQVVGVFPQKERRTYKVTFTDGTSTRCGPDHLWTVAKTHHSAQQDVFNRRAWRTVTTKELIDCGVRRPKPCGRKGAYIRVPVAEPVFHTPKQYDLDPYTLGAFLGDGCGSVANPQITLCNRDWMDIYPWLNPSPTSSRKATGCRQFTYPRAFRDKLPCAAKVKSKEKYIPLEYMQGSIAQRKELLRGLMDTDGSARNNRITFHTCSPRLSEGVAELVRGLGGIAVVRKYVRGGGKPTEWQVNVKTKFCPFRVQRKAQEWRPRKLSKIIDSIVLVEDTAHVCIKVANASELYLTKDFIVTHNTSIVLAAFDELKKMGIARRMLVIAPKRVCYLVWRQEGQEWEQFKHLTFGLLHGRDKEKVLADTSKDIYLINPEGVKWLVENLTAAQFKAMFDTVCLDELTKFKNAQANRSKFLRGGKVKGVKYPNLLSGVARRWGLTGTPAPNGLKDLFGQMLILDDGVALGKYFTHFRDRYFTPGFDGFSLLPQRGAEERIQERLKYCTLRMKAEDYIELPELIRNPIILEMDKKSRKAYSEMKREMVTELEDGVITAANMAATYNKLKQMAGGAVYLGQPERGVKRKVHVLHSLKLDALDELVESLGGQPLLLAYEFNHELDRILEHFGQDLPYLGKGVSDARAMDIELAWNRNEIPLLPVHPASSGHGLNLQKGNACHLCWFGPIWDFELYDQLVRRLRRQGNQSKTVHEHTLIVKDTIDELALESKDEKDHTQARLLQGMSELLSVKAETPAGDVPAQQMETEDMNKLDASGGGVPPGWGAPAQQTEQPAATPAQTTAPPGWGVPAAEPAASPPPPPAQTTAAPGWGSPAAEPAASPPPPPAQTTAAPGWGSPAAEPATQEVAQAQEQTLTQAGQPADAPAATPQPLQRNDSVVGYADAPEKPYHAHISMNAGGRHFSASVSGSTKEELMASLAEVAAFIP